MSNDNLVVNRAPCVSNSLALRVEREPMYFDDGENTFFGWYHHTEAAMHRDCVAVICAPLGYEYTRSHRSMRHLADRLAQAGIPAVRFDYHGTGDSPGSDLDTERWRCWQSNARAAIVRAQKMSGRRRICLIGVRLGATLAALVASEISVDLLVLWNPCNRGATYLRELQTIALSAKHEASVTSGRLESAGYVISAQTIATLRNIDLLELAFHSSSRVLVAGRDDLTADKALNTHLSACGIENEYASLPGYAAMMAEHQFTVVPEEAFKKISEWICSHSDKNVSTPSSHEVALRQSTAKDFVHLTGAQNRLSIEEHLCRFGFDQQLFGILTKPTLASDRPVVVMFNAGAVHHVGPHRLYVTLARRLAALGFPSLRFDLEGIGDSVLRGAGRENHPYPDTAMRDAREALDFLKKRYGYTRFIPIGLCSGAHTAFHTGVECETDEIVELVLINPLTYYWVEGMSLETTQHFRHVLAYRKSVRSLASWGRLLRGKVDFPSLLRMVQSYPRTIARAYYDALRETLLPATRTPLSRDLQKLFMHKRQLTLIVARGDPGLDILKAGARRTAAKGLRSGQIRLQWVANADHTFSQQNARDELIERIGKLLTERHS